jgi:DNA-binding IclR family transcriptional regulator
MLDLLSRAEDGETLSSIARHLAAPKNSVVSLLAGMLQSDHVSRDERAVYRLGPATLQLSLRIAGGVRLRGLVRPALERIRDATGETALAGMALPGQDLLAYIEKAESLHPMRYTVPIGERREFHSTAAGKLILAFMPQQELEACLQRIDLTPLTGTTITSVTRLKAELKRIRQSGIASTRDERIDGASAIAAAVVDPQGRLVNSLVVVGPSARLLRRADEHTAVLVREARQLSELVAGAGDALKRQP